MLMEAIDIAKEMAMYKTSIEFLRMKEQRVINVLHNYPGEGIEESLATVKRVIEKAECCLEEASTSYYHIRDQYKLRMSQ